MIIPIFIYRYREKTEKELQEERDRDRRWKKMMRDEEERVKEAKLRQKKEEHRKKEEEMKAASRQYDIDREKDPWQFSFLPEGWSIFGQRYIGTLPWDGENPQPQKGYGYID